MLQVIPKVLLCLLKLLLKFLIVYDELVIHDILTSLIALNQVSAKCWGICCHFSKSVSHWIQSWSVSISLYLLKSLLLLSLCFYKSK